MLVAYAAPAVSVPSFPPRSAFVGFRFPSEVIVLAVRWYLRYGFVLPGGCRGRSGWAVEGLDMSLTTDVGAAGVGE